MILIFLFMIHLKQTSLSIVGELNDLFEFLCYCYFLISDKTELAWLRYKYLRWEPCSQDLLSNWTWTHATSIQMFTIRAILTRFIIEHWTHSISQSNEHLVHAISSSPCSLIKMDCCDFDTITRSWNIRAEITRLYLALANTYVLGISSNIRPTY